MFELAFDNFQYILQGRQNFDLFETPLKSRETRIHNIIAYMKEQNINPIYGLSACFSYYSYKNRKRKKLPILTLGTLTPDYIHHAYKNQRRYDNKYHMGYDTLIFLDSIYLRGSYTYFNMSDTYLLQLNEMKEQLIKDFYLRPYLEQTKEQLRRSMLNKNNDYLVWKDIILIEGAMNISPVLLMFDPDFSKIISGLTNEEYFWFLNGIGSDTSLDASIEDEKYLLKFNESLKIEGVRYVRECHAS